MKKAMTLTVISVLAVVLCVALVSPLHSAPPDWANQDETGPPEWAANPGEPGPTSGAKPLWKITDAIWVDHAPNPRFAVYTAGTPYDESDDVVLDKETGLVWKKIAGTTLRNWYEANSNCKVEDAGGRMGWRLPTVEELLSLVIRTFPGISLPVGHPFSIVDDPETQPVYWSSTTNLEDPDRANGLCFTPDPCYFWDHKSDNIHYNWCVRGGYGYDAY